MKIVSNTEKGLIEIDTDKLPDVESAVLEKAVEFQNLCKAFDVQCFLTYGNNSNIHMDWHVGKDQSSPDNWAKLWNLIGQSIYILSNKKIGTYFITEKED